jgi:hypothetical protein
MRKGKPREIQVGGPILACDPWLQSGHQLAAFTSFLALMGGLFVSLHDFPVRPDRAAVLGRSRLAVSI